MMQCRLPRPILRAAVAAAISVAVATASAAEGSRPEPPRTQADAVAMAMELSRAAGPQSPAGSLDQSRLAASADQLAAIPTAWILPCLPAFTAATPAGANWLRSSLDRAVERAGAALSADELAGVVTDRQRPARVRSLAFGWLRDRAEPRADGLLDGMLDDPALELRRAAVEKRLAAAAALEEPGQRELHRRCLAAARDVDQIERIAGWLSEHGEPVDVADVLGFVRSWQVSEAFDNAKGSGFARAFGPETKLPARPDAAAWKQVVSADKHGAIDLNAAIATKKGVLAYAVADVVMAAGGQAEVRIGSPCAVAVWVNGTPVMAHEIYHASEAIDQYVAPALFQAGVNTVLVKCCQNEQTEPWAADWKFQLRVCDAAGTPLATQPRSASAPTP